ncbi:MAG: Hsp20 family protein [Candidatus Thiodiazotropha sp.]|nr:Hsp20 family protein [Candidatus Thiodiazotropha sp.]
MRKYLKLFSVILAVVFSSSIYAQPPGHYSSGASFSRTADGPSSFNMQRHIRFRQEQDDTGYHLRILFHGYSPDALQVKVQGRSLLVENQEAHRVENRGDRGYSFSTTSSSMRRRFRLPGDADVEAMQRTEKDGEIVITLPYRPYRQYE